MKTLLSAILLTLVGALAMTTPATAETAHDFRFQAIEGGELPLSQFKGKAVLVVNTASMCGYTPQYKGLQALWEAWQGKGLVVLGVPSNDFGGQEPGSGEQIKQFCEVNFAIDFPLAAKEKVTGPGAHPFYRWVTAQKGAPRWNFHKYLIGPDGSLIGAFGSGTAPESPELQTAVRQALGG